MTQIKRRLGLTVPVSLYEKLVSKAEYQGKTINSTCLDIFWDYFEGIQKSEKNQQKKQYRKRGEKKCFGN